MDKLSIVVGSPFTGKSVEVCLKYPECLLVDVDRCLDEKPDITLRHLLNTRVVQPYKNGDQIVIEDRVYSETRIKSVIDVCKKKLPLCCPKLLCVHPMFGWNQLNWLFENHLAEITLNFHQTCFHQHINRLNRALNEINSYSQGDDLERDFGTTTVTTQVPIRIQTFCKFDVPALFIQFESVLTLQSRTSSGVTLADAAKAVCSWCTKFPRGRVILIHDGLQSHATLSGDDTEKTFIEFANKCSVCPVYLLVLKRHAVTRSYCKPPNPGSIAFLHRLHHISLTSPGTVYLYHSVVHKEMATHAGMKYIKASRVFEHPHLLTSNTAFYKPELPAMISSMKYLKPLRGWCPLVSADMPPASVPLMADVTASESLVKRELEFGKVLYLAYSSNDMLERYNTLYTSTVQPLDADQTSGSRDLATSRNETTIISPAVELQGARVPTWLATRPKSSKKRLMKRKSTESSTTSVEHGSSVGDAQASRTVYIMSADELLETAKRVLLQAGERLPTEQEIQTYRNDQQECVSTAITEFRSPSVGISPSATDQQERVSAAVSGLSLPSVGVSPTVTARASGAEYRKTPRRKRVQNASSIFDEILQSTSSNSDRQTACTSLLSTSFDDAVSDKSARTPAAATAVGTTVSERIADSLVEESSQDISSKDAPVVTGHMALDDSFVKETSSSSVHTTSRSRGSGHSTVPDSLVTGTGSSDQSSKTRGSSHSAVPDSLVTDTASSNQKSAEITSGSVADRSPVKTSGDVSIPARKSSESSGNVLKHNTTSTHVIVDRFVIPKSASTSSKERTASSAGSKRIVSDSLVSMTSSSASAERRRLDDSDVNFVVPESPPLPRKRQAQQETAPQPKLKPTSQVDISFLDDII